MRKKTIFEIIAVVVITLLLSLGLSAQKRILKTDVIIIDGVQVSGLAKDGAAITTGSPQQVATAAAVKEAIAAIPVGSADSTRLVSDSILVYYAAGVETGRDTLRGLGGGGGGVSPAELAANSTNDQNYADGVETAVRGAVVDSTEAVKKFAEGVRKRSRVAASGLPNLAFHLGVDTFLHPALWFNGDSKLNAIHTSSKIQADFGHYFGFAGNGYISLSTYNNGRLGIIPRATGSTRVEYPATDFAKYSLDGHAQELTGTGNVRIEPNENHTTYTSNIECQFWDYAKISYLRHPSGGDIRIVVDGTTLTTISANGVETKMFYEITGLADTSHILEIQNVTGTNYTLDGYFLRSSVRAPIVNVVANSGYDASDWVDLFAFDNKQFLADHPPVVIVERLGANDSNRDFTPTQFATNVARLVDTFRNYSPVADVALIGIEGMALGATYSDAQYNSELRDTADARRFLSFDLLDAVPDMVEFQTRGFSDDATHENEKGSHLIGGYIVDKLLSADGVRGGSGGSVAIPTLQQVTGAGATSSLDLTLLGRILLNYTGNNVLIGNDVARVRTTFASGVQVGYQSGYNLTSGNSNTLIGYQAGYRLTTGQKNNVFGVQSFFNNRTGSENLAIGSQAGSSDVAANPVFTSNNSIFLGPRSKPLADNTINEIVIGYEAEGKGSNTATIGGPSTTDVYLTGNTRSERIGIGVVGAPLADIHVGSETGNAEIRIDAGQFANLVIGSDLLGTGNRDAKLTFETGGIGRGGMGIDQNNDNAITIGFGSPGTSSPIFIRRSGERVGLSVNPQRKLDVNGDMRLRTISAGAPTRIIGAEADGDIVEYPLNLIPGDDLGSHTATQNLDAGGFQVSNAGNATTGTALPTRDQVQDSIEAAIPLIFTASGTLDFPSTIADASSDLTISVTGAVVGNPVLIGGPLPSGNTDYYASVTAPNVVTIKFSNNSSSTVDPPSATFTVKVFQ